MNRKPVGSEELKDAILRMMVERFGDRPLDNPSETVTHDMRMEAIVKSKDYRQEQQTRDLARFRRQKAEKEAIKRLDRKWQSEKDKAEKYVRAIIANKRVPPGADEVIKSTRAVSPNPATLAVSARYEQTPQPKGIFSGERGPLFDMLYRRKT